MRLTWKREWTFILVALLTLRIIISVVGVMTVSNGMPEALGAGEELFAPVAALRTEAASRALVNVWMRWDTAWYLKIAASGYSSGDGSIAFMPLYPWLIKGAGFLLGGNLLLGAILVSNLAALVATILLYELALREIKFKTHAIQSVLAMLVFPSGFFLLAAYSESLFLALILGAWLCARDKRWWAAGILAALGTLCRMQGALLSPVLLWMYLVSAAGADGLKPGGQIRVVWRMLTSAEGWGQARNSLLQPAGLAVLLPGLTMISFQAWLKYANLGNIPQALMNHWGIRTVMPWEGLQLFMDRLMNTRRVFIDSIDLGILLLMLVVCIYASLRMDPAYSLYNWLNVGLFFMRGTPPHLLDSFSRYLLLLFPAFLVFGAIKNRKVAMALGVVSFVVQLFLVMGFLDWRWVA
jgi:hypothetical protein